MFYYRPVNRRSLLTQTREWVELLESQVRGDGVACEDLLSRLAEAVPGVRYRIRGHGGKVAFITDGCYELTGHEPDAFTSGEVTWVELVEEADRAKVFSHLRDALSGERPLDAVYRVRDRDGAVHWVWDRGHCVQQADGEMAVEGHALDLTPQLDLELSRHRADRSGRLAQVIRKSIHDLNNLFTSMVGFLDLLIMSRREDQELISQLTRVRSVAERAMEVNRKTREAAHGQGSGRVLVDPAALAREVADAVSAGLESEIPILVGSTGGTATVQGDPSDLSCALTALVRNALEARPPGAVEIRLVPSASEVRIEVRDSGPGIPADQLTQLERPFFSTRNRTGFGLTLARTVAADHGGRLEIESRLGRGSVFALVLPTPQPSESGHRVFEQHWR